MDLITCTEELAEVCARMAQHPFVTVDTEFLRESTYYPLLCVAQIASPDEAAVIDALAAGIDLASLFTLLTNESVVKVFHAARQDIEIFWNMAGKIPHPIFDTQVAAMVLGYGDSISYDQLVLRITGDTLDKSNRFTDWTRRPLTDAQIAYARSDVTHLRDVYLKLAADLKKRNRVNWVEAEMAVLTSTETYRADPERAWERLKTRVLKDDTVGEIAVQAPTTIEKLGHLRSLPKGFERSRWGPEIVEAVKRGLGCDPTTLPRLERFRPAHNGAAIVELLKVLLRMTAERHAVAAKVIATVDELDRIAADDEADVPALKGWRRELFGEKALALKHGKLALAIEKSKVVTVEKANS
jgi:ribonuclease D